MARIALDDGHGRRTPGKRSPASLGPVLFENDFNKAVVALLADELRRCRQTVILTAPSDHDDPIGTRVSRAAAQGAQLLISIHANAGGGTGIETFYWHTSPKGERLARLIQEGLVAATGLRNRGKKTSSTKHNNYGVLRISAAKGIAACLPECGFMDTAGDLALLRTDSYRRTCARAMAKAVCLYLGVPYIGG